ncbi:MAG: xanthine phosphoribosyltransferase [Acholeplasmataceae bacterium]|jgi:xanthine phosphoribosyltransferase
MNFIQQEILRRGKILPGNVLKVNSFLNHQLDPSLLNMMADEWYRLFKDEGVNKVITIESSGIALALLTAIKLGNLPVVFAKKGESSNLGNAYTSTVYSYTKNTNYYISIEKQFLNQKDRVIVIDDFLAKGSACLGMIDILTQANVSIAGIGIAIEKGFQEGGKLLREKGYRVESLAIIESMNSKDSTIKFK